MKKILDMAKLKIIVMMCIPMLGFAQNDSITMNQAIDLALANNMKVKAAEQRVQYQQQLKKASSELPKTEVDLMYGQYNSILNDNNVSITQAIPFPTVFTSRNAYNKSLIQSSQAQQQSVQNDLRYQVKLLCVQSYYLYARKKILVQQDSLYSVLREASLKRYQVGEETKLESIKTTARLNEIKNSLLQVNADIEIIQSALQALLNSTSRVIIKDEPQLVLGMPGADQATAESNPNVQVMQYNADAAMKFKQLERAKTLPELRIGYFTQTLTGFQTINGQEQYFGKDKRFDGLQVGIGIPLWVFPHASQVKASGYASKQADSELQQAKTDWQSQKQKANQQALKDKASLEYYLQSGLPMATLIQSQSVKSYQQGEISMTELLMNMNQSLTIQESYIKTLLDYNQSIINIEFLIGQ